MPVEPSPPSLDGDSFVGEGIRKFTIAFIEVNVYRLALYIDAPVAAKLLESFKGLPHTTLCQDPGFFQEFVRGRFRKTFLLTFLRNVGAARLQDGFRTPLLKRVPAMQASEVEQLVSAVPDVNEGDVILFRIHGDGGQVELSIPKVHKHVLVTSQQVWHGTQNIFFDSETEMPNIKHGAVENLPDILCSMQPDVCLEPATLVSKGCLPGQSSSARQKPVEYSTIHASENVGLDVRRLALDTQTACLHFLRGFALNLCNACAISASSSGPRAMHAQFPYAYAVSGHQRDCSSTSSTSSTSAQGDVFSIDPNGTNQKQMQPRDYDLLVEVYELGDLRDAEYRLGDLSRSLFSDANLFSVYCQLRLGKTTKETVRSSGRHEPKAIRFSDERFIFAYNGEAELHIDVRDCRPVQGIIRGDPLVGEADLRLGPEFTIGSSDCEFLRLHEQKLTIARNGQPAGYVWLRYRLQERSSMHVPQHSAAGYFPNDAPST